MKVIRLNQSDKVVQKLTERLSKEPGGIVFGLGALHNATIMLYNLKDRSYKKKSINGPLEVCSFTAVLSKAPDGKTTLHPHIVVAGEDFKAWGGHLEEAEVGPTFEAVFIKSEQILKREYSKTIGLNLLK